MYPCGTCEVKANDITHNLKDFENKGLFSIKGPKCLHIFQLKCFKLENALFNPLHSF